MKDKRNLLKIACIIEVIYVLISIIYSALTIKVKDQLLAELFIHLIDIFFVIMLYKESKKDEKVLKKNKGKIVISTIWLFISSIIPGILCILYLSSLKEKKKINLPVIERKKESFFSTLKQVLLIILFVLIMFVLPKYKFFHMFPTYLPYVIIFILVLLFNYKYIIEDFKIFKNNIKVYLPFVIKRYLYMLLIMIVVAVPVVLINNGSTSNNQKMLNAMFSKLPLISVLLSCLYAPFVEENIFRLSLSKIVKNKYFFIILSAIIFGFLHVFDKSNSIKDYLFVFQYSALGICLAKAYSDSNNIFVSISMHFMQNFLAALLVLIFF